MSHSPLPSLLFQKHRLLTLCAVCLLGIAALTGCTHPEGASPAAPSPAHSRMMATGQNHTPFGMVPAPAPELTERFPAATSNPVNTVTDQPVSTFSVDVDTASYARVRRFLANGTRPPRDAVRVEEMINYFTYDYAVPKDKGSPFLPTVHLMPTPWNEDTQLLHIGIKGYDIPRKRRPAANIVFLIDVSGSMQSRDKLELVKKSVRLLVDSLDERDTVAITVYAGAAGVVLEPTPGSEKRRIRKALNRLKSGGSTAGAAGIEQAYALAQDHFDPDKLNRVILATDGDFNVGVTDPKKLEDLIVRKRKSGVFLSVLGYGTGNTNDVIMQKIAQAGNGVAAYIDTLAEARKVLVNDMTSTLFPIAKDVKIQVEFNPAHVSEYRLIGYETRMLRREDFKNDKVDAGDVGAGHTVTAIYEITPVGSKARLVEPLRYASGQTVKQSATTSDEIAFLKIRYKHPDGDKSHLMTRPIRANEAIETLAKAPEDARFAAAVAAFGQTLRGEALAEDMDLRSILGLADAARGADPYGYRAEFTNLVRNAISTDVADADG